MAARRKAIQARGLLHPSPEAVTAAVFLSHPEFFWAVDKLQVKYEMLRAHVVEGVSVVEAAASHGYSRASFYLALRAFEEGGLLGLIDERPGRRGPMKVTPEVRSFLAARARERPELSGAELAVELERALGVRLHRRTVERAVAALERSR